jgi:hypothetical protein
VKGAWGVHCMSWSRAGRWCKMARSSKQRVVYAAPVLAFALLGLANLPGHDAFTLTSAPGLSAFTSANQATALSSAKIITQVDKRGALLSRNGAASVSMAAVKNPSLIGQMIPRTWSEGSEFIRDGRNINKGDLVIIARSDGSERLGEVIGKTGLPWQNAFEVCVELDGAGQAGASRAEEGINLGKPKPAALAALGAGGSKVTAPPLASRGTAPVPVFGSQKPPAARPPPPARPPPAAPAARPPPPARAPPPAPVARAPPAPAARPFSTQRVAAAAPAGPTSTLKFSEQVGKAIPSAWAEGKDFTAGGRYTAGELIIVRRSDGSLKFGEIIKQEGFLGGAYEVLYAALHS